MGCNGDVEIGWEHYGNISSSLVPWHSMSVGAISVGGLVLAFSGIHPNTSVFLSEK